MRYFDDIRYASISGQDRVSHARMVAPLFELSPLNKINRGKLVRFITLIPFETFG